MNLPLSLRDRQTSRWSYPRCRESQQLPSQSARTERRSAATRKSTGAFSESPEVVGVLNAVATMSDQEVRERFHELVDRGRGSLDTLERFELERIEARLDAEDRDPALEARQQQWQRERADLIGSIEELLAKLKRSPPNWHGDLHSTGESAPAQRSSEVRSTLAQGLRLPMRLTRTNRGLLWRPRGLRSGSFPASKQVPGA